MKTISDSGISILNPEPKKPYKLDSWLKRVLSYPGRDEREIYLNILSWKADTVHPHLQPVTPWWFADIGTTGNFVYPL